MALGESILGTSGSLGLLYCHRWSRSVIMSLHCVPLSWIGAGPREPAIGSLTDPRQRDRVRHRVVAEVAGVEVVPAVVSRIVMARITGCAGRGGEVDDPVGGGA